MMSAANARAKHKTDAGDRAKHAAQDDELFLSSAVLFAAKCAVETRDFWSNLIVNVSKNFGAVLAQNTRAAAAEASRRKQGDAACLRKLLR